MRPPVLPSGNFWVDDNARVQLMCFNEAAGFTQRKPSRADAHATAAHSGFNEAAGFTQRKHIPRHARQLIRCQASMRPPVLPSGNACDEGTPYPPVNALQ